MASDLSPRRILPGVGGPNGPRLTPFDRWFRYPAGFSAHALEACLRGLEERSLVVDPFAGVATIGVRVVARGLRFGGIEAHREIAELASLKFRSAREPKDLLSAAKSIVVDLEPMDGDAEPELVRSSFDPQALNTIVAIRERIQTQPDNPWHFHLKWSLLGALRDCAHVKVGWPYQRPGMRRRPRYSSPEQAFIRRATWMAEDLAESDFGERGSMICGDARRADPWQEIGEYAGAIITSPPYLNNYDYADATRLELYFWGTVRTWRELTRTIRAPLIAASTQQTTRPGSEAANRELLRLVPKSAERIAGLEARLRAERARRPRGKEYDQLLVMYFRDLTLALVQMRDHSLPGAPVRLVLGDSAPYGVYVDTPALIEGLAMELGFERMTRRALRTRGLRWHSNGMRHAIPLSEQLVELRSPGFAQQGQEAVR